jgi:Spy/CpxP family protein refolding chaperone
MKMLTGVTGGLIALLVTLGAEGLAAQRMGPQQQRPGDGRRARMEQMIRGRFDAMVRQQLGLTDEQSQNLTDVLDVYREQRRDFMEDEQSTRRQLMTLGAEGEITEEQAIDALQDMLRLRENEVRLFREEQEALVGVLSARQLLRFVVMREQLNQRIQSIRAGGGRGMGMGPPGGRRPGAGPPGGFRLER